MVGEHTYKLLQGDSHLLLRQVPDHCIDFILTDPPYNLAPHSTGNIPLPGRTAMNNDLAPWDLIDFKPEEWIDEFLRIYHQLHRVVGVRIQLCNVQHMIEAVDVIHVERPSGCWLTRALVLFLILFQNHPSGIIGTEDECTIGLHLQSINLVACIVLLKTFELCGVEYAEVLIQRTLGVEHRTT